MNTEAEHDLEILEAGTGAPCVLLPGMFNLEGGTQVVDRWSRDRALMVAKFPGYGDRPRPKWCDSVDDLARLVDVAITSRGLEDVTLVGCSLGGWVAAELATRRPAWLGRLVLVDAVGIRVGAPTERDVLDVFIVSQDEVARSMFAAPEFAARYLSPQGKDESEVIDIAKAQEAIAVYAWRRYMHDPKLARRLAHVLVPSLVVWGAQDAVVSSDYGRAYAAAIPGAEFVEIDGCGHVPLIERPEQALEAIDRFIGETTTSGASI